MAVRKDTIQVDVQIKADQGVKQFQKLTDDSRKFSRQLTQLEKAGKKNTDEYRAMEKQLQQTNKRLAELGGKGATLGQLQGRAKALNREIKSLAPGTQRFIQATRELRSVNTRMREIRDETRQAANGLNQMRQNASGLPGIFGKISGVFNPIAIAAGVGLLARQLFDLGKQAVEFFNVQAQADAQLRASLESTGGVAGRTFEELSKAADELQSKTLFGDEETQKAQALLLTFTQIREEIFDRATPAILDMSTALDQDLKTSTIAIGKALNDPIKGVTALGRAGIQFTKDQKETIKTLVETNRVAEAQTLILDELETQFGGSAEAAAKAGTGGLTQLQNKVNDIKESIGALIVNGLQRAAPFLNKMADFVGKLVDTLLSGKKATGEYATAINFLIKALQAATFGVRLLWEIVKTRFNQMVTVFNFLYDVGLKVKAGFDDLVESAKRFEFIRIIINNVSKVFSFFNDLISNIPATFAGIRAAAKQMAENIKANFEVLALSAQLFLKKLELATSIKEATRTRIQNEIKLLEDFKKLAKEKGQEIGQAYTEARDNFIAQQNAKRQDIVLPTANPTQIPGAPASSTITPSSTPTNAGASAGSISDNTSSTASSASSGGTGPFFINPELIRKAADEKFMLEQELLKEQFFKGVLAHQEYEDQLFQLKQEELQRRLQYLVEQGKGESLAAKKIQNEITQNLIEENQKRLENTRRTEELKRQTQHMSYQAFKGVVEASIALLGADEERRKKNASIIKAFSVGKVIADGFAEIQSIWRTANANPSNILFPGSGAIIAGAKSAAAGLRTAAAVRKISSTNFYDGGFTGNKGLFKDNKGRDVVGGVHAGEWVAPAWQVDHPEYGPVIKSLENARTRGFNEGGFARVNTNFSPGINESIQTAGGNDNAFIMSIAQSIIDSNEQTVQAIQNKRFEVPATQVQDSLEDIENLQREASF